MTQFRDLILAQVNASCPESVIEIIETNMILSDKADARVEKEGIVVRDLKGSVIQHPAIKIQADAQKVISNLMDKYRKRARN